MNSGTTPEAPPTRPARLGLTGSIGAGKSSVAALLREAGLTVLDADAAAREVTGEPEVLAELERTFPGVVQGGALDRAALAAQVFGDPAKLAQLNALTHPRVRARLARAEAEAAERGEAWVVQDVPLLFEGGLEAGMDAVLLVEAPLETRLERVALRSGLSREDALARDARQLPQEEKRRRAAALPRAAVIDNSGDLGALRGEVRRALAELGIPTPGLV